MPVMVSGAGVSLQQNPAFAMETMETMCRERREKHNAEVPGRKKTGGISFTMDLATTAERSGEVERRPNKKRGHKSLGAREGGGLHGSSCEGVLLDLDDCLQKSLDASRQTPLPFKHSGASSFTPAAAVRQGKKEQICF